MMSRNYLRVRGEYYSVTMGIVFTPELPPRARRIQSSPPNIFSVLGTTSACAENTLYLHRCARPVRNYLRVRGEYPQKTTIPLILMELPPRARRIRRGHSVLYSSLGTTSACAENTPPTRGGCVHHGNYLRVRGEYLLRFIASATSAELPPRARRIPGRRLGSNRVKGTTSACAENTRSVMLSCWNSWNYLRVRGEYCGSIPIIYGFAELPPRARRILGLNALMGMCIGTTSACAENTTHHPRR